LFSFHRSRSEPFSDAEIKVPSCTVVPGYFVSKMNVIAEKSALCSVISSVVCTLQFWVGIAQPLKTVKFHTLFRLFTEIL
jgi:hypothetical protein